MLSCAGPPLNTNSPSAVPRQDSSRVMMSYACFSKCEELQLQRLRQTLPVAHRVSACRFMFSLKRDLADLGESVKGAGTESFHELGMHDARSFMRTYCGACFKTYEKPS